MTFSILVVSFNPGAKLNKTIDSIKKQTFKEFEILIKDGGSTDGSFEEFCQIQELDLMKSKNKSIVNQKIKVFQSKDKGIYDAMNQVVKEAEGDYVLYLNCGDTFYNNRVLEKAAEYIHQVDAKQVVVKQINNKYTDIKQAHSRKADGKHKIFYGDTYCEGSNAMVAMPAVITDFTCYRNIPCHQSCFYQRQLFDQHPYQLNYSIRADYEHFLWCFYQGGANPIHMGITVSAYEGGGYSEHVDNVKRDKIEHKEIVSIYLSKKQIFQYRIIMALSLVKLRKWIAEKSVFAGMYNKVKNLCYKR